MLKKNWSNILLAISLLFFLGSKIFYKPKQNKYIVFKTDSGWAYRIYSKDKVFIEQFNIPAASGYQAFKTKEEATRIANLVVKKMVNNKGQMPDVTLHELDSCKINYTK